MGFVHSRCVEMMKQGVTVKVFVWHHIEERYTYEGVDVARLPLTKEAYHEVNECDVIGVHFLLKDFISVVQSGEVDRPIVVWAHGYETLGWWRRLFNFRFDREFFKYAKSNMKQLVSLRQFIRSKPNAAFIYVSNWMHKVAERDLFTEISRFHTIANPIDIELFKYKQKPVEQRLKVLSIRPYSSRKYANDISVAAVERLSKYKEFSKFEFLFVGDGPLFTPLMKRLEKFENVRCQRTFLNHSEIAALHQEYGVFLCPTRQDAQGVSMCEAMSSGLVPISSNSTAIPEFVEAGESGFVASGVDEVVEALLSLYDSPDLFVKLSQSAAESIGVKCDAKRIVAQELEVCASMVGDARVNAEDV